MLKTIRSGNDPSGRCGTKNISVENVNHPGHVKLVDADMYKAMKRALLKAIPRTSPWLTVAEMERRAFACLPEKLFPGGAKSSWWAKTVQLDQEARGILVREHQAASFTERTTLAFCEL